MQHAAAAPRQRSVIDDHGQPSRWYATTRPEPPSTVTSWPLLRSLVPRPVPMIAGIPYSRATMAACEASPPESTTTAAARWKSGVQDGLVAGQTRISPSFRVPNSRWFAYDPDGSGHPTTTGWRPRHQRVRILQRRKDQIRIDERYAGQFFAPGRPASHHIAQPVSLTRLNAAGVGNCLDLFQPQVIDVLGRVQNAGGAEPPAGLQTAPVERLAMPNRPRRACPPG